MAKTVEYLARGVPVVAADLTETRRSADEAALYVPNGTPQEYAAALDELLDDAPRRELMRKAGLARFADRLAWEHQARAYAAVWHRLLARRRGGGGSGTADPSTDIPRQRSAGVDSPAAHQ
jgi:glycosyltransferase involved in cell wall biosynthesis